ncbi:MAG: TRAP-type C4-dicarboxylate transport system small permease component [Spirochaetes bacterium]|nr:MAG: TRAP-type C4-dicarboxylate transport system small permease component [Spirochaetota bacterium]
MKHFMALVKKVDTVLYVMAGAILVGMVLLTLCDVILRNFGYPITGSMEIIMYGGALVFGFSIPLASMLKAQVQVDLIVEKLKPRNKKAVTIATRVVGILLFLFVAYNFFLYGFDVKRTGEITSSFKIPYYPIVFALSFSFLFQSLTLIYDLVEVIREKADAMEESAS